MPNWRDKLKNFPNQNPDFIQAIDQQQRQALALFLKGIDAYRYHPYHRPEIRQPPFWQQGPVQAWTYGRDLPADAPIILALPSLINRYTILDSHPSVSFVHFMAQQGIHPIIVDWHGSDAGKDWGFEAYFDHLSELIAALRQHFPQAPIHLLGYCMGGNLALATGQLYNQFASLILLATPWDFSHLHQHPGYRFVHDWTMRSINDKGYLPLDWLQTMFLLLKPLQSLAKFQVFADLDLDSETAERFVAVEDWLNDGVPLSGPVAQVCMEDWIGTNQLCQDGWFVDDQKIDPTLIKMPTLIVQSTQDHLVPLSSSQPLVAKMPHADNWQLDLGHIGMMSSQRAEALLWSPLAKRLRAIK